MTDTAQVPREVIEPFAIVFNAAEAGYYWSDEESFPHTSLTYGHFRRLRDALAAAPQATDPRDAEIERLTKLNAGLCRDFNSLLVRESHARTDIATLTAERDALREVAALARIKLARYCAQHGGHAIGGVAAEYNAVLKRIDEALATQPSKTETRDDG